MSAIDAVSDISHDALGALGTIRLAVTTLLEHGADADLRMQLLTAADAEAVRVVADLSAVSAVVAVCSDDSAVAPVDLAGALHAARQEVLGFGVDVHVKAEPPLLTLARPNSVAAALAALLRYGAARGGSEIEAAADATRIRVRFSGADLRGPVVTRLLGVFDALVADSLRADGFDLGLAMESR